jgi:hypothetical protein
MTKVTNKLQINYTNADIVRSSTPIRLSARAKEEFDENVGPSSSDENEVVVSNRLLTVAFSPPQESVSQRHRLSRRSELLK